MDRRRFLKLVTASAAAFVAPALIVPERKVFALDRTMIPIRQDDRMSALQAAINNASARGGGVVSVPPLRGGDDASFIQWHVDHSVTVPSGHYEISRPV